MNIVYYINQFFAQVGGESAANYPLEVREACIGPVIPFSSGVSKAGGEVVATIICGDNYFAENLENVREEIINILKKYNAQILVAGPAFNAGRYGLACGEIMKIAQQYIGIPAISAMYPENPGVDMYKLYGYIFPTTINARGMKDVMPKLIEFTKKILSDKKIGSPEEEGYFLRGVRKNVLDSKTGAQRAVDMMLAKIKGEHFVTELQMPVFNRVDPSPAIKDLKTATIAVMTSGGIVPKGNPDRLESLTCTKWKKYNVDSFGGVGIPDTEVAHGGYDPSFANQDANRVLPVDALAELEKEGYIGQLYDSFYVTVGNGMPIDRATMFGDAIGKELKGKVDGVILTST